MVLFHPDHRGRYLRRVLTLVVLTALGCTPLLPGDDTLDGGFVSDGDASQDASDAAICGAACPCTPQVTGVSRSVVAHGARLVVEGSCLTGASMLRIGGVAQGFAVAGEDLVVDEVFDTTTIGLNVPLVVETPLGESAPRPLTVVRLVVNEVDSHTGNGANDTNEFVELDTGLAAAVDLTGYAVLFVSGDTPTTYDDIPAIALGMSAANGRYVIGNPGVSGVRATFPSRSLGESSGVHGVLVVQSDDLPVAGTALSTIDAPIIDAIAYSKSSASQNAALLTRCFPSAAGRAQGDESASGSSATAALARCQAARRDGRVFTAFAPTPGLANGCP
jgi:hypothetical protein